MSSEDRRGATSSSSCADASVCLSCPEFEWDESGAEELDDSELGGTDPWKIAIVDDDPCVHEATSFALQGVEILRRPLRLFHAYSADEGLDLFRNEADIAAALIDVVMESPNAGLELVDAVRSLGLTEMRLILRTGQPGYAPELAVLQSYDINDYRTKTELSSARLSSVLTTALRGYQQITAVNQMRAGLELIVHGVADLFCRESLEVFSSGVLTQFSALLKSATEGIVCAAGQDSDRPVSLDGMEVIYGSGSFAGYAGSAMSAIQAADLRAAHGAVTPATSPLISDGGLALRCRSKDGCELFVYVRTSHAVAEPDITLLKVLSANVTLSFERVQLVERLDRLAFYDETLNLLNSNGFDRAITGLDPRLPWSVALIHVEGLDSVISGFGVRRAQQYLRQVITRVQATLPQLSLVARTEPDVFAIAFAEPVTPSALHAAFSMAVELDGAVIPVRATMAVLLLEPANVREASEVRRSLKATLVAAREHSPGGIYLYRHELRDKVARRLQVQSSLLRTLAGGREFSIMLQPKVELGTGTVVGAEALARWSMQGASVSPVEFVPVVEASGLARTLRDRVIEEVGSWVQMRRRHGQSIPPVAINLSIADIAEPHFASSLIARAEAAGLSPETLHLELTESEMMESLASTRRELRMLREAGYPIAIDDFGTGYSSLSYLENLPVTSLKIDRSFVRSLSPSNAQSSLAGTTMSMARGLGLGVVAEGVENEEQHLALLSLGCPVAQGYLYSPPVDVGAFPL